MVKSKTLTKIEGDFIMKQVIITVVALGLSLGIYIVFQITTAFSADTIEVFNDKNIDGEEIDEVSISTSSTDIQVEPNESNQIIIKWGGKTTQKEWKKYRLTTNINGDKLEIKLDKSNPFSFSFEMTGVRDINLQVYLPRKIYNSLEVHSSSGEMLIQTMEAKYTDVGASSGSIKLTEIKSEVLEASVSSGEIYIYKSEFNDATTSTSSGDIYIEENRIKQINAKSSSGNIEINNEMLTGDIIAKTSSGDVHLFLEKEPASFLIDYKSSSGDERINIEGINFEKNSDHHVVGMKGNGEHNITVRTSSGDFSFTH